MKKIGIVTFLSFVAYTATAQHSHTPLANQVDSMSYAVGMNIASSLKNGGIDTLNYEVFKEALKDIIEYNHASMNAQLSNKVVQDYVAAANAKKAAREKAAGATYIAAGEAFLETNKKKEGVKVTPSGLQYKIIKAGTGPIPKDGQTVKAHYHGTLIDGKKFDSSYDRGQPLTIGVNSVIPGWTEALKLMPVGSTWEIYIPQNLGYGARAMGAKIPAYSTLIFTMELMEIVQ